MKYIRNVNADDHSLSANIVRLLCQIMTENLLIRKYDLRFNPLSNDAAIMIF
jgi:S-ribosylhomocysteine lyase LuxS involved in autoinducer biosynthesis